MYRYVPDNCTALCRSAIFCSGSHDPPGSVRREASTSRPVTPYVTAVRSLTTRQFVCGLLSHVERLGSRKPGVKPSQDTVGPSCSLRLAATHIRTGGLGTSRNGCTPREPERHGHAQSTRIGRDSDVPPGTGTAVLCGGSRDQDPLPKLSTTRGRGVTTLQETSRRSLRMGTPAWLQTLSAGR